MIIVLASSRDSVAARLVSYWGADSARLLSPADLSCSGWRYRPGNARRSVAMVGGQRVPASDIEGVLVRLPYVPVDDLPHIQLHDRDYVAQEMTAFVTAWLTELPCRVLNRPTAECLAGPGWSLEQWLHTAAGLGIQVKSQRGDRRSRFAVTVVGTRCFGGAPSWSVSYEPARRLADAAGTDLLEVHFARTAAGPRLVQVDPWPDVSQPEIADTLLECMRSG